MTARSKPAEDAGQQEPEVPDNVVALPERREPDSRNLYQRITDSQAELRNIAKIKRGNLDYAYITVDALFDLLRPVLARNGIVILPQEIDWELNAATTSQNKQTWRAIYHMNLRLVNADNPTDFVELKRSGIADDVGDKALQKAETYAVKYGLLKLFLLGGDDDDESGRKSEHDDTQASAGHTPAPQRHTLPVLVEKCPACKGALEVVYNPGKKAFVGHAVYPNDCGEKIPWNVMTGIIKRAENMAAAEAATTESLARKQREAAEAAAQQATTGAAEATTPPIDHVLDLLTEKAGEPIEDAGRAISLIIQYNADRDFLLRACAAVFRSQVVPPERRKELYGEAGIEGTWASVEALGATQLAEFTGALTAAYFTAKFPRLEGVE